ncbi:MAG: flagellar biosynthesis protein FlgN [Treponema sp.]|jgi:hypothetical protein|nr:flagellar biosynthesis protein FlgN [Treponema sp.]
MALTLPDSTQTRLCELLCAQEERFSRYLLLLGKQRDAIEQGNGEALLAYIELQEQTLASIHALEKVITPLRVAGTDAAFEARLGRLKRESAAHSRQNQELLAKRMNTLRSEIRQFRAQPLCRQSRRNTMSGTTPTFIDISM